MDREDLRFFNPDADVTHTANRLPHWQQSGAVHFLNFRLADSIPKHLLDQWENERVIWMDTHPQPWSTDTEREYHARFSGAVERRLDAGHGSCVLRDHAHAAIVGEALQHFDGVRVAQIAWIVMPNHVHAIFVLQGDWTLEQMIHSWKLFSARRINERLGRQRISPLRIRSRSRRKVTRNGGLPITDHAPAKPQIFWRGRTLAAARD